MKAHDPMLSVLNPEVKKKSTPKKKKAVKE